MIFHTIKQYSIVILTTLAVVFFVLGSVILILEKWNFADPYVVLNPKSPKSHYARQNDRNWVTIGREFEIKRDVQLRIYRELLTKSYADSDGKKLWHGKELDTTYVLYHPGRYIRERDVRLPVVEPGEYTITSFVCWRVNFLRDRCINLPDVKVQIVEMPIAQMSYDR